MDASERYLFQKRSLAVHAKPKANAPKILSSANAAEPHAAPAGQVKCDRPILAHVAGVTERVTCRRSASVVRGSYPSFRGDSRTVATEFEVSNRDRSVGIDVLYKLSTQHKVYTPRLFARAFP
jgi:hypothetical protein